MSQSVSQYVSLIESSDNLTFDNEKELIIKAQMGDELSKKKLFSAYLKLVFSIAKKHLIYPLNIEDLLQEGVLGLEDALQRFQVGRV